MMSEHYSDLSALLGLVRNRWRLLVALRAWTRAAAAAALVLALALLAHRVILPDGLALMLLWSVAGAGVLICLASVIVSVRRAPRDLQIARFIEERCPELEDVLVTAVGEHAPGSGPIVAAVVDEARRRVREIDSDRIISRRARRRAGLVAGAAASALFLLVAFSAGPAGQAARLVGVHLFPERLALDVAPGDVTIRAGDPLRVVAKISSAAAVVPVLRVGEGAQWRQTRMEAAHDGFAVVFERVEQDFRYSVQAAGTSSREYAVTVVRPPHVERIDLRYEYPPAFRMPARNEEDGGDIYGPAGTRVHVTVHADKPVTRAALNVSGGQPIVLERRGEALEGEVIIAEDGSYRVALADADGLSNPGDTEYFIRTLQDRPPDVRIVRPASDRQVTPVEEVSIEARAEDDFGVAALDLVYAIGGGPERVLPFEREGSGNAVSGRRTVYLEDLGVRPGDFVAYYARARDLSRGKRSTEARSDMFFLDVTSFEEEFVASQSQGAPGGGDAGALEDLVQQQKEIVTATWNLDRRGREARGRSDDDIRAVARAQRDLRARVVATLAQMQRASDLRRRRQVAGRGGQEGPDAMVEAIGRSVEAMAGAHQQLEALKTNEALPREMTALSELLLAQAEVRRREVQQQANGTGGRGSNRQQQDVSSLFDRELARQQHTNYETPGRPETREEKADDNDALEKIGELARRQDALSRSQQALAKNREKTPADELRRELERLTREQSDLRRQVEELARQVPQGAQAQGQQGQGQPGDGSRGQASLDLQQISEDMQGAASELRREHPQEASARGNRAAERLRDLEQRMRGAQMDDRLRAARGESEDSARLTEELSRIRELREELAGLDQQLSDLRGRSGDPTSGSQSGGVHSGDAPAPWQTARDLLNELQRENRLENPREAVGFSPGRSAPGTEAWKQDFAQWDELKVQIAAALEHAERNAADRLRDQQSNDRLNAGATQAVPEAYRRLVEKYYRALASGK